MTVEPISKLTVSHLREIVEWPDLDHERYAVREVLGRGGMGTVFRAYDAVLEREVALKVMSSTISETGVPARLRVEQQTIARLEHPGIVPIYDAGTTRDGRGFYVMRLVRGRTLEEMLVSASGEFASDIRFRVFERVCEAVAFAHAEGVVHCDLKPSNVMIGAFGEVFVLDWGLAHQSVAESRGPVVESMGTPGYMAPEQRAGAQTAASLDARADVYSLGALLRVLALEPRAGAARAQAAIIERAQATRPTDRYADVSSLLDDVRRWQAGQPVLAYRESFGERVVRNGRRYQVPLVLILMYLFVRAVILVAVGR
jgi:eukaryotic-like serine/threonine-protein kinase